MSDEYLDPFKSPLTERQRSALDLLPVNFAQIDSADWLAGLAIRGELDVVGNLLVRGAVNVAHGFGYRECSLTKEGRRLLDEARVAT